MTVQTTAAAPITEVPVEDPTGAAAAAVPKPLAGRRPGAIGWALLAPLLAWLAVFVVAPTAIMFVYSFCRRDALGEIV